MIISKDSLTVFPVLIAYHLKLGCAIDKSNMFKTQDNLFSVHYWQINKPYLLEALEERIRSKQQDNHVKF